jgi:hypothetical protein
MHDTLQPDLLAEETESGRAWIFLLLFALLAPILGLWLAHRRETLWIMILLAVIAVITCAMAWSGFQYRFLRDAVEIRTLGFRLRSIPTQSIVSYAIEPWPFIRGRGIRGIGRSRAYVWSNQVVHIKTTNADIYLGHNDPERIIHDLEMVTAGVSRGSSPD